jgi:hypothetical protein
VTTISENQLGPWWGKYRQRVAVVVATSSVLTLLALVLSLVALLRG